MHDAQPAGLREALVPPGGGVGHVAWLADSLADETERLVALGLTPFHTGRTGPASAVWFDGGPLLGHPVEVLQRRDEILGFYAMVRAAGRAAGMEPSQSPDARAARMIPDEVDVLVAGFGAAGAAAAIAARQSGATVAVVEKWPHGGGNCLHSGGLRVRTRRPEGRRAP